MREGEDEESNGDYEESKEDKDSNMKKIRKKGEYDEVDDKTEEHKTSLEIVNRYRRRKWRRLW